MSAWLAFVLGLVVGIIGRIGVMLVAGAALHGGARSFIDPNGEG